MGVIKNTRFVTAREQLFNLNFGPQHPSAHGVLRLILQLSGERILQTDTHIGLLHRGTEKLLEHRSYEKGLGYFDRLDYVSMMAQEYAFAAAIERLLQRAPSREMQLGRVVFLEITRLLNHLLSITTHAMDVGAFTPFLWGFEEREKLMEFYERVSGARMHALWLRPSAERSAGAAFDRRLLHDIQAFAVPMADRIREFEFLLNANRIWQARLRGVGFVSLDAAIRWGFSGPMVRGSGLCWDLRAQSALRRFVPRVPVSCRGDSFGRYLVRVAEMKESLHLILAAVAELLSAPTTPPAVSGSSDLASMESLIVHFKKRLDFESLGTGFYYSGVEAPKGEFGVAVWQAGGGHPYRCRLRAPGFAHLQGLSFMAIGHLLADAVTVIGTQDIVFGEVDR